MCLLPVFVERSQPSHNPERPLAVMLSLLVTHARRSLFHCRDKLAADAFSYSPRREEQADDNPFVSRGNNKNASRPRSLSPSSDWEYTQERPSRSEKAAHHQSPTLKEEIQYLLTLVRPSTNFKVSFESGALAILNPRTENLTFTVYERIVKHLRASKEDIMALATGVAALIRYKNNIVYSSPDDPSLRRQIRNLIEVVVTSEAKGERVKSLSNNLAQSTANVSFDEVFALLETADILPESSSDELTILATTIWAMIKSFDSNIYEQISR